MQNKFFGSKLNTVLLLILIVLMVIAIRFMYKNKAVYLPFLIQNQTNNDWKKYPLDTTPGYPCGIYGSECLQPEISKTYIYNKYGFSIELPEGYMPSEMEAEGGPSISINLPNNSVISYFSDASFNEQNGLKSYKYLQDMKIGEYMFQVYSYGDHTFYWIKNGNSGYEFSGDISLLFKFKLTK